MLTFCSSSIRSACPEGIYLSFLPSDLSQWSGVFFVREGKIEGIFLPTPGLSYLGRPLRTRDIKISRFVSTRISCSGALNYFH